MIKIPIHINCSMNHAFSLRYASLGEFSNSWNAGQARRNGVFNASEVLAKHDENYMPPEVQAALEQAHNKGVQDAANAVASDEAKGTASSY